MVGCSPFARLKTRSLCIKSPHSNPRAICPRNRYGTQNFHQFVYGRKTKVEANHKPLQYILSQPLHQAPLILQKMLLTMQRYDLKVKYRSGSERSVAGELSRSYLQETTESLIPDLEVNELSLLRTFPFHQRSMQSSRKPLQMIQACKPFVPLVTSSSELDAESQ